MREQFPAAVGTTSPVANDHTLPLPDEEILDSQFIQPLAPELPLPVLPQLSCPSLVENPMGEEVELVCGSPFDRELRYKQHDGS